MRLILELALLAAGFFLLVKGADLFVDGAAGLASALRIPQIVIGLTIVAMGTSAPEAAISISSSLRGSAGIAVGNIIGSNIINVLLILGITTIITPLPVRRATVFMEIPFVVFITCVFSALGLADNLVARLDGGILWLLFIIYLAYLYFTTRSGGGDEEEEGKKIKPVLLPVYILCGGVMLVAGSNLTVGSASELARMFGVSDRVIGLTVVAFGTSLPELVTCVAAGIKKEADLAVGNIVGSNIFNILFVIGTAALIRPVVYDTRFLTDSIMCIGTACLLFLLSAGKKHTIGRAGGIIMLAVYAAYFAVMTGGIL